MWRSLVILVTACGGAGVSPVANQVRTGGPTLATALERDVGRGGSVALVGDAGGLRAVSSDGARQRVLVPGEIGWAIVDARSNVVWFSPWDRDEIDALDLDGEDVPTPRVERVVLDVPHATVAIGYPPPASATESAGERQFETAMSAATYDHNLMGAHALLAVSAAPSLSIEPGMMPGTESTNQQLAAAAKKARVVGLDFLRGLASRRPHEQAAHPPAKEERVAGVDPALCQDTSPTDCGSAEPIAHTAFWRVIVQTACGDGCGRIHRLYDTRTQQFVADDWGLQLVDGEVSPDGRAFVARGAIYSFASGPLPAPPAPADHTYNGGGWLGGGVWYGL